MASCSISDNKVKPTLSVNINSVSCDSGGNVHVVLGYSLPPASNAYSIWDYGIIVEYSLDGSNWFGVSVLFEYNNTGGQANRWNSKSGTKSGTFDVWKNVNVAAGFNIYVRLNDRDSKAHNNVPSAPCTLNTGDLRIPLAEVILDNDVFQFKNIKDRGILTYKLNPTFATYYSVEFGSSNTNVIKIDKTTGVMTPVSSGYAKVTAKVVSCDGKEFYISADVECRLSTVRYCVNGKYVECEVYYCVGGKYIRCEVGYCSNGKFVQIG